MINIKNKSNCSGCFACVNACPQKCINIKEDLEGFCYPLVNEENCINCGLCEKICPIINKDEKALESNNPKAYAVINNNYDIRIKSSSGGIFSLLAEAVINNGGVVFGAAFTDDFYSVKHIWIDKTEDIKKLRGSKYIQSDIGKSYIDAKGFLEKGIEVMFVGTPCQIAGLKNFLRKKYKNLYTIDLICHGVPSKAVWKKYLKEKEIKNNSSVNKISFRNKCDGWLNYCLSLDFANNNNYTKKVNRDLYMNGFLQNLYLRPSCYECSFKGYRKNSDITLADFFGVQKILPEFFDNIGTSLVIINSEFGEKLLTNISKFINYKEVNLNEAVRYNSAFWKSSVPHKNRDLFFKNFERLGFEKSVKKVLNINFFSICIKKFRQCLAKIYRTIRRGIKK